jgi:hypothetical protein
MFRIAIAVALVLVSGVHAAGDPEFNVDFFCGWDGYYRPMEWMPVEIGIGSDLKEPFAGTFTISTRQDGLNTMNVVHPFVLTPDVPLTVPLVTKFAAWTEKCELTIRDRRGRRQWGQTINMLDFSITNRLLRVAQEEDMLVGLIGQGQFGLLRLPRDAACRSYRGPGKVYVGAKVPRAAPWDWTGFVSLDLLVLYDPDWALLRRQQVRAIREWISNGGTVLLVLGRHPLPTDSPLSEVLPFQVGEPRQVAIPSAALEEWGLDSSLPESVTAWSLVPKSGATLMRTVRTSDAECLYGMAAAGFGRIAVLSFNPVQLSEDQVGRTAEFWTRHIGACIGNGPGSSEGPAGRGSPAGHGRTIVLSNDEAEEPDGAPGRNPRDNRYRISLAQNASNQVMEHLYQLRQMRPLSIWWVILTLSALAILLGPVDYLVLKRLDKLPYTWLTSIGWILVFTVGAYYGVQWLRGGAMELRIVSVLDGIADSNCAWATSYTGLFAPRSDDYQFEGLMPNQWWSGIAPSREEIWRHQQESGMRQIHCVQADGGNLPVSLPVNIWTVQSLVTEWGLTEMPFVATVARGDDQLTVEISNRSDSPIRSGCVLLEDACADLGLVPAQATKRVTVRARPFFSWQNRGKVTGLDPRGRATGRWSDADLPRYPTNFEGRADHAFFAAGCLNRTLAMHTCLRLGAALVCVVFEDPPAPFTVKGRSYAVNHTQFARQLILPTQPSEDTSHD